jgi:rhamnosyl/mannosyltransferase
VKILQLASFYSPVVGGMETVLKDLAEGLVRGGDEVTVLCASVGPGRSDAPEAGVRVVRSPSLGKLLSQPLTPLLPADLLRLRGGHDLVHLHMPNPLAEAAVLMLPASVRIVVTYHSDIVRQRALKPFYGSVRRAVLHRARRILVPTENHIRYSEVLPAFAPKCDVIPFGIAAHRYRLSVTAERLRDELKRRHGRFGLFVGRLVYYKGILELAESMARVNGRLIVAGDGPLRPRLEQKLDELRLRDRVILAGALGQTELNAYFAACEFVVLPSISRAEGFGITLLEGMLFGKALISTRLPSGVRSVNEDGRTGFQVPPGDRTALAQALDALFADAALADRLGAGGREVLAARFSYDHMLQAHRRVYQQVTEA